MNVIRTPVFNIGKINSKKINYTTSMGLNTFWFSARRSYVGMRVTSEKCLLKINI